MTYVITTISNGMTHYFCKDRKFRLHHDLPKSPKKALAIYKYNHNATKTGNVLVKRKVIKEYLVKEYFL